MRRGQSPAAPVCGKRLLCPLACRSRPVRRGRMHAARARLPAMPFLRCVGVWSMRRGGIHAARQGCALRGVCGKCGRLSRSVGRDLGPAAPVCGKCLPYPFTCRSRPVRRGRMHAARQGFAVTQGSRLGARLRRSVGRAFTPAANIAFFKNHRCGGAKAPPYRAKTHAMPTVNGQPPHAIAP